MSLYDEDTFVVLETNQPEQFLTVAELLEKLRGILASPQEELPPDVQKISSVEQQAKYLINTYCELDVGPGKFLQWYAVRLENWHSSAWKHEDSWINQSICSLMLPPLSRDCSVPKRLFRRAPPYLNWFLIASNL